MSFMLVLLPPLHVWAMATVCTSATIQCLLLRPVLPNLLLLECIRAALALGSPWQCLGT